MSLFDLFLDLKMSWFPTSKWGPFSVEKWTRKMRFPRFGGRISRSIIGPEIEVSIKGWWCLDLILRPDLGPISRSKRWDFSTSQSKGPHFEARFEVPKWGLNSTTLWLRGREMSLFEVDNRARKVAQKGPKKSQKEATFGSFFDLFLAHFGAHFEVRKWLFFGPLKRPEKTSFYRPENVTFWVTFWTSENGRLNRKSLRKCEISGPIKWCF